MHAKNANKAFTEDHTEQKVVVVVVVCLFVCLFVLGEGVGWQNCLQQSFSKRTREQGETIISPNFQFLVGYMLYILKSGVGVGGWGCGDEGGSSESSAYYTFIGLYTTHSKQCSFNN